MNEIFAIYESGLQCLLEHFGPDHERYIDLALLKSRFLISTQNLRRYGENEPVEYGHFLRILTQLHQICAETFHTDFDSWCNKCIIDKQKHRRDQQEPLQPYIGNWQGLQDGRLQHFLRNELARLGLHLDTSRNIPAEDPLERYKKLPLHAFILFTSQDPVILPYIQAHWDALDSLSRDIYDIHVSTAGLNNAEDGHDALATSYVVKKTGFQEYSLLPGILFWDKLGAWEFVSFGQRTDDSMITWIWRLLSEKLEVNPSIETVRKVHTIIRKRLDALSPEKASEHNRKNGVYLIEDDLEYTLPVAAPGGKFQDIVNIIDTPSSRLPITTPDSLAASSDTTPDISTQLIAELRNMPTGDGNQYEELIEKVLVFCLADEFHPLHLKTQVATYNNKRRKDFVIDNRNTRVGLWQELKRRGVVKILFDAKNYGHRISYPEITSTLRYLIRNKSYGNFIIFLTRHGIKDYEELLEDYEANQQVALFLDDKDIISMIKKKRSGGIASSVIEDKYYEFLDMK